MVSDRAAAVAGHAGARVSASQPEGCNANLHVFRSLPHHREQVKGWGYAVYTWLIKLKKGLRGCGEEGGRKWIDGMIRSLSVYIYQGLLGVGPLYAPTQYLPVLTFY